MTKEEQKIKETAEDMLIKIIQYLNAACKSQEELSHRCSELSASLISCQADWNKGTDEIVKDLNALGKDITMMAIGGAIRYKMGDTSNSKNI